MDKVKKIVNKIAPPPAKGPDGRDQWPSRASFLLACISGVLGMGNFLRYPSTVFNNNGIQWFLPYLMALALLAIPALTLELAAGSAYRGGTVTAYNKISRRMRGIGFGLNYIGFVVSIYFIPIIAWGMVYFQKSFVSPLEWAGRTQDYFLYDVASAVPGDTSGDWVSYPDSGFDARLVGWNTFLWFLVWACICRGTGWTGRVVYFTVGMPLIVIIILVGRGCSLENAGEGIRMYFGTWRNEALAGTRIWQDAVGQVFYSTGPGFGYYTAYASYNSVHANAPQDAVIIACTNAFLEALLAFGAFGIVGFMGLRPDPDNRMGSYDLGFVTYPEAFNQMPGANFWSALFFLTIAIVGVGSTFVMLDAVMTLIMDSAIARRRSWTRMKVSTALVIFVYLLSLPNCTHIGYYYMDGIDAWINNLGLPFIVWAECLTATTVYRYTDVLSQVGMPAFALYNATYIGAQFLALVVGHTVSIAAGAGVGFGTFIIGTVVSVLISKTPDVKPDVRFFNRNAFTGKLYFLALYSGNQLRHDLNAVMDVSGKKWSLPVIWAPCLRYITCPILSIILSLAYARFDAVASDPLHVMGFIIGHFLLLWAVAGFIFPSWLDIFIIEERRDDWKQYTAPCVVRDVTEGHVVEESGESSSLDAAMGEKGTNGEKDLTRDDSSGSSPTRGRD